MKNVIMAEREKEIIEYSLLNSLILIPTETSFIPFNI